MSTSKHHIERLTRLLKDRVAEEGEEGKEWGATEMGGSVVFTLFGKRGVWSCGPDGCDGTGFLLSVQGYSKRQKNPSPPKAWIRLTPAPDNSTDVDFYADKEYQSLFESLVSELVDPVQEEHRSVREDNAQQQEIVAPSDSKPWEKVPEGKDREFARLWYEDISSDEIAARLDYADAKAVGTQASRLRKIFGKEVIPMRRNEGRWGMYHLEKD